MPTVILGFLLRNGTETGLKPTATFSFAKDMHYKGTDNSCCSEMYFNSG